MSKIKLEFRVNSLSELDLIGTNEYQFVVKFFQTDGTTPLNHASIPNTLTIQVETTSNEFVYVSGITVDETVNTVVKAFNNTDTDCCFASGLFTLVPDDIIETPARFEWYSAAGLQGSVWLPKNYSPAKKYAVIYANDGETLFAKDERNPNWNFDVRTQALIDAGEILNCIVVGIIHPVRMQTLLPNKPFYTMPSGDQAAIAGHNGGLPLADDHINNIVNHVKPYIDATYSTHTDNENTVILGASMGGLFAAYAFGERSDVFGKAACMSTHYQGTLVDTSANLFTDDMVNYIQNNFPAPSAQKKVYFDSGTESLDSDYLIPQGQVDTILEGKGYVENVNYKTVIEIGAGHDASFWGNRLPGVLRFLIPKPGAPNFQALTDFLNENSSSY